MTAESPPQWPLPAPDALSRPFWDGARRGDLVIQRCTACGYYIHPPYPICPECCSDELSHAKVAGTGTIYERAIVEAPVVTGFADEVPYACILVELDEQPGLLVSSNLVDAPPYAAEVGRRVEVVWDAEQSGFVRPMFRLSTEHGA